MSARILIVEDDAIIARDIRTKLQDLGYSVVAVVASGEAAMSAVTSTHPDLVLMDIHIQGPIDGIETAAGIRDSYATPVIYLTSHSDDITVQSAKSTGAYGYVLKPFTDRDLRTAIEVALEKHEIERRLAKRERWFATTLRAITEAVIAVDASGSITFMNPAAEALTGLAVADALGRSAVANSARLLDLFLADGVTPCREWSDGARNAGGAARVARVNASAVDRRALGHRNQRVDRRQRNCSPSW